MQWFTTFKTEARTERVERRYPVQWSITTETEGVENVARGLLLPRLEKVASGLSLPSLRGWRR